MDIRVNSRHCVGCIAVCNVCLAVVLGKSSPCAVSGLESWCTKVLDTKMHNELSSLCTTAGNFGCNFAACYSCHARERMRRKWSLPPIFGLPPGIDDCLVHFFCFYCSSHQELRELAVRGVDGPGMHMFDLVPDSYKHIEGAQAAIDARRVLVEHMVSKPPKILTAREKKVKEAKKEVDVTTIAPSEGSEASEQFGWMQYKAPKVQVRERGNFPRFE